MTADKASPTCLQTALITSCSDCTIVMGAVGRLLRVEKLDKVQVMAATTRCVVASCHDCSLFLGTNRQPTLIGDNRFLRIAPLNTRYERQISHLDKAGVRLDLPNRWDSPLVLAGEWQQPPCTQMVQVCTSGQYLACFYYARL